MSNTVLTNLGDSTDNDKISTYYYNDINIRLLSYLTIIYDNKSNKYNLDLFTISFNEYYKSKIDKANIKKDLETLIEYYIDDGSSLILDQNDEDCLMINDLVDIKILLDKVIRYSTDVKEVKQKKSKNVQKPTDYENLMNLLSCTCESNNNTDYNKLNKLLNEKTYFYKLYRERLKHKNDNKNFTPVCTDDHNYTHSMKILKYYNINSNKTVDWTKFKTQLSSDEIHCFSNKIHFLPIIVKNVTDLQLGDCSYLDTCHKFQQNNINCKYIHYFEYRPNHSIDLNHNTKKTRKNCFIEFEESIDEIDPLFTFNISNYKKTARKAIPIKCDIRKYDFTKLQSQNFNAIIADPPWNIHMNLPYGTCNDQELFELPLHKLQSPKMNEYYNVFDKTGDCNAISNRFVYKKGGIMALWVTVRSINLGKQLLVANGYKIMNELSWIKINQLCRTIVTGRTGHWLNHSKEHLLIGYKGNVDDWLLLRQQDLDYIVSQTRETSRKPDELYDILERLCGEHSNNLELFGRETNLRESWVTLGNQL
ncbi:hypothetical protein ACO0SA_004436 [Hanseniaspora valbyensis]